MYFNELPPETGIPVAGEEIPSPTMTYSFAATGGMLGFSHVDRGLSLGLADALGRALAGRGPLGFAGTAEYDAAHRPVAAVVVGSDGTAKVAGRSAFSDKNQASAELNNAGKPVGGLSQSGWAKICGFSLMGAPAATVAAYSRSYKTGPGGMPALDLPAVSDVAIKPAGLGLQAASYTAVLQHDAAGRPLESADPFGHVSQTHYRLSGVPDWVKVDGQPMLSDIRYNARGQTLSLAQGSFDDSDSSGAYHTLLRYAPKDLRMRQSYVTKSASFAAAQTGETSVIDGSSDPGRLSDSRHGFDPLGNVVEASGVWPDTVFGHIGTTAISRYRHDARYRLLAAGGLEGPAGSPIASKPMQGPAANALSFESGWASLTPYFQSYHYDPGGNLTALNHFANGAADAKRSASWQVSSGSNRAIATSWYNSLSGESRTGSGSLPESFFSQGDTPLFDAGGQQLRTPELSSIVWDWQGQVASISFTDPSNSEATVTEYYAYLPGGGVRSRKIRETANASGQLAGLEVTEYFGETEKRADYSQADASSPVLYDGETVTNGAVKTDYSTLRFRLGHGQAARILSGKLSESGPANETRSFFDISDPIDSVQMELDETGNIASYQRYYPYGGTAFAAQSAETLSLQLKANQYSGQEKDSSGLYFYGYRYYDSSNMRWTRPDPAGTRGSGFNWYAMVGGNPVTHRDVMGLKKEADRRQSGPPVVFRRPNPFPMVGLDRFREFMHFAGQLPGFRVFPEPVAMFPDNSLSIILSSELGNDFDHSVTLGLNMSSSDDSIFRFTTRYVNLNNYNNQMQNFYSNLGWVHRNETHDGNRYSYQLYQSFSGIRNSTTVEGFMEKLETLRRIQFNLRSILRTLPPNRTARINDRRYSRENLQHALSVIDPVVAHYTPNIPISSNLTSQHPNLLRGIEESIEQNNSVIFISDYRNILTSPAFTSLNDNPHYDYSLDLQLDAFGRHWFAQRNDSEIDPARREWTQDVYITERLLRHLAARHGGWHFMSRRNPNFRSFTLSGPYQLPGLRENFYQLNLDVDFHNLLRPRLGRPVQGRGRGQAPRGRGRGGPRPGRGGRNQPRSGPGGNSNNPSALDMRE